MTDINYVYLVTGGTGGIGRATAAALATRRDGRVAIVGRDRSRTDAAAAQLSNETGGQVDPFVADLCDLDQVRGLAASVLDRYRRLDVLVNNAAVAFGPARVIFTTNHLAPFLLTSLLRERMVQTSGSRVVNVSSSMHRQVRVVPWQRLGVETDGVNQYQVSKLLSVLFTRALSHRLAGTGVTANAADPGFVRTGLGRGATGAFKLFLTLARPFQLSAAAGARTAVYLAVDPAIAGVTGGYFAKCRQVEPSPLAQDDQAAEQLWQLSERLTES
jgi:NAD(P)-dependent dehydrogenase (short-subunit alcohol dehydrogenase family)